MSLSKVYFDIWNTTSWQYYLPSTMGVDEGSGMLACITASRSSKVSIVGPSPKDGSSWFSPEVPLIWSAWATSVIYQRSENNRDASYLVRNFERIMKRSSSINAQDDHRRTQKSGISRRACRYITRTRLRMWRRNNNQQLEMKQQSIARTSCQDDEGWNPVEKQQQCKTS